jgi:purine-binding chemotaxis protein CheW
MSNTNKNRESGATRASGGKFLTFFLDREEYGIEILSVREIIGLLPVTPVPQTPHYVQGVVNLRGQVIPVVDLRLKFDMPGIDATDESCIIVVQTSGTQLGIIVDKVSEVLDILSQDIVDAPTLGNEIDTDYIMGVGKSGTRVILLLDIGRVFPSVEIEAAVAA